MAKKRESGFDAIARLIKSESDDIRKHMATKEQVVALHTQVNSIEGQLRGMKHGKLEGRVDDLEVKVFGKMRA